MGGTGGTGGREESQREAGERETYRGLKGEEEGQYEKRNRNYSSLAGAPTYSTSTHTIATTFDECVQAWSGEYRETELMSCV